MFVLAPAAAPDPVAPLPVLVDNLGGQVLDVAVGLAPVAVPFVLALAAIGFVMDKFGLSARIELAQMDRAAAAKESAAADRAARRAARKQAKWDNMVEEAQWENKRRNLRKRVTGSYSRESDF